MPEITELLKLARDGDRGALDELFARLYPELRRIAHARLAGHQRDAMIDTTALVHECYLKLSSSERLSARDRAHFVAYAATAMRSIIVDLARARATGRRGGNALHVPLTTDLADRLPAGEEEILDVDTALARVAAIDPRLSRLIEMRYFGGMSDADIAAVLGVTDRTIRRDWQKARLLMASALQR